MEIWGELVRRGAYQSMGVYQRILRKYLKETFPDGMALDTIYVGNSLVQQVEASIDESLSSTG